MHDKYVDLIFRLKGIKTFRILAYPFYLFTVKTNSIKYRWGDESKKIKELKDQYLGERCFIVGNGPSLDIEDLEMIKGEYSFATNGIYNIFEKTDWRPNFYCCTDAEFAHSHSREIRKNVSKISKLLSNATKKYIGVSDESIFFNEVKPYSFERYRLPSPQFSEDVSLRVFTHGTVLFFVSQIAFYMGFKEVIYIGVDNSYSKMMMNGEIVIDKTISKNHFDLMKEFNTSSLYNIKAANEGFELISQMAKYKDIKVFNATRGGHLEAFERISLESLKRG